MAKKSKLIENRIQSSRHVIGSGETHCDQIAERLAARAIEVEGPGTKLDKAYFVSLIHFLTGALAASVKGMDTAELKVVAEKADDVGLREGRDAATAGLITECVRVRSMVNDALGASSLATYGLEKETPRTPREVASHARTVVGLLKEKPFTETVGGVTFNSAGIAANLETKAATLDKAIGDMTREEQELAFALGRRDEAVAAWSDDHQGIADMLVGALRLAGLKDLSERVRPTSRVLSGEEVTDPAKPLPEPTPVPTGGSSGG